MPCSRTSDCVNNCICLKTTRARGYMLRRLCTARETKLQLAASLARRQPKAIVGKITSPGSFDEVTGWVDVVVS